jgi:diacylglycerol kinase (ATP)
MRSAWVLHNPSAGQPAYVRQVECAANALARRGVLVRVERPADPGDLRRLARAAVAEAVDAVVVAGGDGTVELAYTAVALGCLPAGTGNVWAHALGLPRPWPWDPRATERAALRLAEAPVRLTDMGLANRQRFLVWAGMGLDAFVTQQFEAHRANIRRMGGFFYAMGLTLVALRGGRPIQARIRALGPDGEREVGGHYLMVTVANIGWHAGGLLRLARDVWLDDGQMDIWAFAGETYADMLAHGMRMLRGEHLRNPHVLRLTGERFEIYTPQPQVFHLDAEPQPAVERLVVEVLSRCLRVIVPAPAAHELYRA